MMILNDIYRKYLKELKSIYSEGEAAGITSIVFEHVAGVTRSDVIKQPQLQLSGQISTTLELFLKRLMLNEPVQYITGEAHFCNLKFSVSDAVLIPRPETEELALTAIEFIKKNNKRSAIDIGTGSGCIAISLAKFTDAVVDAVDVSSDAIRIASSNATIHGAAVQFHHKDFLNEISWGNLSKYDVIISNPPYIPLSEKSLMDTNVTEHEPHLALFVQNERPLIFYEKISGFALSHLNDDGIVFMETHENFANEVSELFTSRGFAATVKKDISGKERIVFATRCR